MSKKLGIIVLVLCVIALCLSAAALVRTCRPAAAEAKDIQYVLYLGTNDKDSNQPVFTPEEAQKQAEAILIDCFGGYTIQEARGGWIDGDTEYQEYTLVIYLSDTSIDEVHKAAARLVNTFHQSTVLIQANETTTEFFGG